MGLSGQGGRFATKHDLIVTRWGARFMGRYIPCAIGRGGLVQNKVEGDLGTPIGTYRLLWMYWRPDRSERPKTILPTLPLGPRQGWSETPDDPLYNQPIQHPHPFPADRMRRGDPLYDLCVVTDQNMHPTVPGHGSAIFLHLWRRPRYPTAGCVTFSRPDLEFILRRWQDTSRLIVR